MILRDSPGLRNKSVRTYTKIKRHKWSTHGGSVPRPTFSFASVDDFPVLLLDHPRLLRLAFDPTRGLAVPNTFSRFGSTSTTKGENGFRTSRVGAGDMILWSCTTG